MVVRDSSRTSTAETSAETLQGYVVDIACLRKYPRDELLDRAPVHTKRCALMGHCMESGYGLVSDDGRVALLEPAATPQIVDAIVRSARSDGIWLRVERESDGPEMRTAVVDVIDHEDQ